MDFFCFKQKTAYEMRISDWSSDVCSSDLTPEVALRPNSVPCGPRSTSTRSRSKNSVSNRRVENSGSPFRWIAVALSQVVPTHRSPMPRIVKLAPVKLVLVKVTLGSEIGRAHV